jgi:pSer/pThr/pTyr-binding forkhead associated (FHA) protein
MATESTQDKKGISPDWLVRGVLTKIGDIFDRLTGRGWKPASSLATSELIERLKSLLDAEAENPDGRGFFVPHNVQLKMQWDKFSADSDDSLRKLENELLTAAIDHINDKRYYTYQPLTIEARPDYFTSGVKLFVSFDRIVDEDEAAAMNVIVPGSKTAELNAAEETRPPLRSETYILNFIENGKPKSLTVKFDQDARKGVGRTKENSIAIDDANISKLHASLVLNASGSLVLADTGSTNGTFINGRRIAYGKAETLNEGDKVNFGTVQVTFQHVAKPAPEQDAVVSPTQAPTVKIDGFEFSSKTPEPPPLQQTIASSEVVLNPIRGDLPETQAGRIETTNGIDATRDRIDLDFSDTGKNGDESK